MQVGATLIMGYPKRVLPVGKFFAENCPDMQVEVVLERGAFCRAWVHFGGLGCILQVVGAFCRILLHFVGRGALCRTWVHCSFTGFTSCKPVPEREGPAWQAWACSASRPLC
jgi:hypothetical protein